MQFLIICETFQFVEDCKKVLDEIGVEYSIEEGLEIVTGEFEEDDEIEKVLELEAIATVEEI